MNKLIFLLFCLLSIVCCKPTLPIYIKESEKYVVGELSEPDFKSIILFLQKHSTQPLKDTIIIKYDFNNEKCWEALDEKPKEYINRVLTGHQTNWAQFRKDRPKVSAFEFREAGKNLSKLVKWNTDIIIDSKNELYNLLIKEKARCGISALILPNQKFIKIRTDPHYDILDLTNEKLLKLISNRL